MSAKQRLRPAPPPRDVNTTLLVTVGVALFLVANVVLLLTGAPAIWTRTALAGWILGGLGLGVIRLQSRSRPRRRTDAATDS